MVRLKTRWLLVQVELMSPSSSSDDDTYIYDSDDGRTVLFPSKKELVRAICDNLLKCSGVAASGAALDTQVRFCDAATRLALIRVPREFCGTVRAAITLLTTIQMQQQQQQQRQPQRSVAVTVTVLSVKGSARTAKMEAIRHVRRFYRERLLLLMRKQANDDKTRDGGGGKALSRKETDQMCRSMEQTLDILVNNIDY